MSWRGGADTELSEQMEDPEQQSGQTHVWEHFEDLGSDGKDPAGVHLVAQLGARGGVPLGGEQEGWSIAASGQRHPAGGRRGGRKRGKHQNRLRVSWTSLDMFGSLLEVTGLLLVLLPSADLQVPPSLEQIRGFHPGDDAKRDSERGGGQHVRAGGSPPFSLSLSLSAPLTAPGRDYWRVSTNSRPQSDVCPGDSVRSGSQGGAEPSPSESMWL